MTLCISHVYILSHSLIQSGISPLYEASQEGHPEVVDILLKNGADPNLATPVWRLVSSFHFCVHCSIVLLLLELPACTA